MIKKWENGERGKVVKEIIDNNFAELDSRVANLEKPNNIVIKTFSTSDWVSGGIFVAYSEYKKASPCVEVYIKTDNGYSVVYGGYIETSDGIKLQSDIAFSGKVVIR